MKILYIASERSRAQVATRALRAISPNVTVLWGSNFERAAFSILENPDLAALIVEVQSDSHGRSYLKQMATLGVEAPVVMVLPEGAGSPNESLKAGAGGYVEKGPSFSQDLPAVISRTIGGGQAPGVVQERPRAETVATPAVAAPAAGTDRDVIHVKEAERRVSDLESPAHQREQRQAAEQSAAAGREAKLEMLLRQEREIRSGLEQRLTDAQAALQDAEHRHVSATTAAAAQLAERNTQYESSVARAASTQKMLDEQLRQIRQSRTAAVNDAERLTQRNAELTSMLTEATERGNALERRLADLETALGAANERASREQTVVAEQISEDHARVQAQLEQESEKRRKLEEDLARARRAQDEAETQRTSAVTAATALWAGRQAQFEADLAQAADTRNTLVREASELKAALDQARQTLQADAADVERLTQREAELTSQLAEAATLRTTLERQLTTTATALKNAEAEASRERVAAETRAAEQASEHQAALQAQLEQEVERRRNVEEELARVQTALDNVEKPHSSVVAVANALLAKRQAQFDAGLAEAAEARRRSSELEAALNHAQQSLQAHAADVERLTRREAELTSQLGEAAATRNTFERQLTDAADALKEAIEGSSRHRLTAATKAAEREREFDGLIRQERSTRADVEQRLSQVEAALHEAQQQSAAAIAAAATERAEREAQFDIRLSQTAAEREDFKRRFSDAETTLASVRDDHAAAATEVERLTQREADLTSQLAQIEAALREAEHDHTLAMTAAATEWAERQAQFDADLSETAGTRDEFQRRCSAADAALASARDDHAAAAAEVERLTQREADLTSQLAEAAATRSALERQLTTTATALKTAEEDASRDRVAAEAKAAEREGEFARLIDHERTARADVEQRLTQVDAALHEATQQHTAALATAATERAERDAQFDAELSHTAATRDEFKRRFTEAETALAAVRHDHAAAAIEVDRLTRREAELASQLAKVEAALREGEHKHSAAMTAAATERAERQAQFDAELSQTAVARDEFKRRFAEAETELAAAQNDHAAAATEVGRLTQRETELTSQLAKVEISLRETEHKHTVAMTAAATERAERQAQFDAELSQTAETRDQFKRRFSEAETALAAARNDLAAAATDVERLTQREAELTSQLAETTKIRSTLERQLTEAEQKHASAMTAAATERAERQAQFDAELSQTADTRDQFKRRFTEAETALAAARQDHAAAAIEVERLTQREAELTSQLAEAAAMRSTLERQLTAAADALEAANEGARRDRTAAETQAAEREGEFARLVDHERTARADVEQRLAQEIARRESLDRTVAEMRSAATDAEQRFRDDIATLTARARDEATQVQNEFANEREGHNTRQTALLNEIQNLEAARGALDDSLASIREHSRRREIEYQRERDGLERARLTAEAEVRRIAAELTEARHDLEKARMDFQQTLDRVTGEHADSLAKLVVESAERDGRIEDLHKQLDESRRELRRQFQDAPLPLWRCTRNGALRDANRALAHLVGYREPDELRDADFVKTVFESTDDLSWLIERCVSTRTRESVETAWKRRNDERLVVRLSAVEFGPDAIEIAVEDVTNVHVLEDRLGRAHRMAAVGGLASETAVTCGRLLRDVREDGQQWLTAVSDDAALRKRGERLLGEIARAASYLERLAAHGDEQASALKPVELNRVLRDLKPVLKHVAGDDVDLELSKTSSSLNVDMKADRVERLFVNLASYGRERMPVGGRLRIELATVVVDQKFIADHPNVRRGHHALITVTAMRREMSGPTSSEAALEKPGVDLGALQELLQECGGHLWLTVDPPGNMVVKIRLPLRVWDDPPHSTTSDTPMSPKRVMARWFRH